MITRVYHLEFRYANGDGTFGEWITMRDAEDKPVSYQSLDEVKTEAKFFAENYDAAEFRVSCFKLEERCPFCP